MTSKKILIVKFSALGDITFSTVIPMVIKKCNPDVQIHYLTSEVNKSILENCTYIDKILTPQEPFSNFILQLFKERYDVVFCLNYTIRCFMYSLLSLPKRIIFKSNKGVSWVENYFYTAKSLFKDVVLPDRLYLQNSDINVENNLEQKLNNYKRPFVVINPGKLNGNARQGRIWDINNWISLKSRILAKYGGTVLVNGSLSERDYHLPLEGENTIVLSGKLSIKEMCAMLSMSDLVISGDSGPVHIASAYNIKTLSLLGSTSPDKIKPYGKNGYYISPNSSCKFCWRKKCKFLKDRYAYAPCINSITVDEVMEKISKHGLIKENQNNQL